MTLRKVIFNNKLFLLLLLLSILINYFLIQLPLFKEFSYEYSAVNALLFFLIIPILVLNSKNLNKSSIIVVTQASTLIFVPLIVAIIKTIFFDICSFIDGLKFYFVISVVSGILSYLLSETIYYFNARLSYIFFFSALLILICVPIIELYVNPQIYFYSPLIGFFPGSIYDEDISVDKKLIIYRLINILLFITFYWFIIKRITVKKFIFVLIVSLTVIISFFIKPLIGFSTTEARLKNILSKKIDSEYFTVYFEKLDSIEQKVLSLHLKYYYSELQKSLNLKPSKKVKVFLFTDSDDMKKYFGSRNADVAKPWLYQIYLDKSSWKSTLKHELAHIFSAEFGSSILKLAGGLNPFLIEGFATSQDPYVDLYPIDYLASIHFRNSDQDIIPDLKKNLNFFSVNSNVSYIYSGSFCKFLIDNYGIDKFKLFYSSNEFEEIYKEDFSKVIDDFKNYLNMYSNQQNEHLYNFFFGRKALIQKVCPRFIEKKIKQGWNYLNDGNIIKAKNIFDNILIDSDNYSALLGKTECLIKQDSLIIAEELLTKYLSKFSKTPYEYLLRLKLADIHTLLDNLPTATEIYTQLEEYEPTLYLKNMSNIRLKLLNAGLLRNYLLANDSLKLKILLQLNNDKYVYSSIPILITLAKNMKLSYQQFLSFFNKKFTDYDQYSSYAFVKLSEFMNDNYDYIRARKIAVLLNRINSNEIFNPYYHNHYKMTEWLYFNAKYFN